MADKDKKPIGSYFTKKVVAVLSAFALVFTIVGGIWAFEAHYATNKRVDKVVVSASSEVQELEIQVASALERQQYKSDARYWQIEYDRIVSDLMELRRQIRRYPEDMILKQDYDDLLERRKDVKQKLENSMDKIKVN